MTGQNQRLPRHVGIIMDGNGRWAKKRGLPRIAGHRQGAQALTAIVRHAKKRGIAVLTAYAFSTENWRRPPEEVQAIMDQLRSFLKDAEKYAGEDVRLVVLGDVAALDEDIRLRIAQVQEKSRHRTGMTLNIALNYGGRRDILHAARQAARMLKSGQLDSAEEIDEELFSYLLYTGDQPEVDLVIRSSGEQRLSNFMLWQSAYAEYWFTDTLWPDFGPRDFDRALEDFAGRTRRKGGI